VGARERKGKDDEVGWGGDVYVVLMQIYPIHLASRCAVFSFVSSNC